MNNFQMTHVQNFSIPSEHDYCAVFSAHEILLKNEDSVYRLPEFRELLLPASTKMLYIGKIGQRKCYAFQLDSALTSTDCVSLNFREALKVLDLTFLAATDRARQMLYWEQENKFCGYCGSKTIISTSETAKVCTECKAHYFPRITPAVITLVTRGDKILLAHNKKFREGLYSLVAGFVEAGESLEEAVEREIHEEVNICVKNIKYFSSQSWPFPNSLMIGFTAEYCSGEIEPDGFEIIDANWFSRDNLPSLPSPASISRKLIDSFIAGSIV